jgi:uncharacterized protein (TIGR02466 family)
MKNVGIGPVWSFGLAKAELSDVELDILLRESNALLANPNAEDYSSQLAGQFSAGKQLKFPSNAVERIVKELATFYLARVFGVENRKLTVYEIWLNSQLAGDYNPVHVHGNSLTGVIYLKVPESISKHKDADEPPTDGAIDFIHSVGHVTTLQTMGVRKVIPYPGLMFIFPGWLQHTVYPFKGPEERRSISFNIEIE